MNAKASFVKVWCRKRSTDSFSNLSSSVQVMFTDIQRCWIELERARKCSVRLLNISVEHFSVE